LCMGLSEWAKQSIIGSVYIYDYALQDCIIQSYPESLRDIVKGFDELVPQWMNPDYQWRMQDGQKIPYGSALPYAILGWKAMLGESPERLREIFGKINDDKRMGGFNFETDLVKIVSLPYMIAAENPAWIAEFDKARLKRGEYDADRKEARIELDAPRPATLCMVSRVAPSGITVNGVQLAAGEFRYDAARKELRIPFGYGAQTVDISYRRYDPKRDRTADLGKQIIRPIPPWPEAALPATVLPIATSTSGQLALLRSQDFKGGEQVASYGYNCTPRPAHLVHPAKKGDKTNIAAAQFTLTQQDFLKIRKRELAEATNVYDKSRFLSLIIYGKDNDKNEPAAPVRISINGKVVYEGANKCVKTDWSTWEIPLNPDCLKDGQNTLTVEDLTPTYTLYHGWFAIHEVTIRVNEKPKE
ncbi:MAG: hypothetical protein HY318_16755, partial [Armatimonadetes bacterium]|nr:hypothetical protein [Armatimonadota bacterium]